MNSITRNLNSLPGILLSLLVLLVILFYVLNVTANKANMIPVVGGSIANAAKFAESRAKPY